ncbi:MAG: phospholipid carrier-dependent glycosyltransferase [Alphaproteobacteria bacterium]|nr:phospholipid carrier-dependent glycosyltransferase [Alphaproteobacteria bacterium]
MSVRDNIARLEPLTLAAITIALLTAARVVAIVLTPLNLGPDEAQYWSWSLTPAFGYFSKPPLIAWVIGASTAVCGDSEACIRISSPLFHAASAIVLYFAGRAFYDAKTGAWAAVTYAVMPGTSFSSLLITTDVPLLFFWSIGLLALAKLRQSAGIGWAIALGIALGLGFLSKYAMLYFLLGAALALLSNEKGRRLILSRDGLIALVVMFLVFAPNIIWNYAHHFATVGHTAANANFGGDFKLSKLLEFLGAQIGIFGPVATALLIWGTARGWLDRVPANADILLIAFAAPPLVIVTVEALISRANGNWAAPAFVSLAILVAALGVRRGVERFLALNFVVNFLIAMLIVALAVSPAVVTALGQDNAAKRLRGWPDAGRTVASVANTGSYSALLFDDREDMGSLFYYARPLKVPLRMWPRAAAGNEYEAAYALTPNESSHVLFVTRRKNASDVLKAFAHSERIATLTTRLDSKRTRIFFLYVLDQPLSTSLNPQN